LLFFPDYRVLRSQHLKNKHSLHQCKEGPQDPSAVVKIITFKQFKNAKKASESIITETLFVSLACDLVLHFDKDERRLDQERERYKKTQKQHAVD